MSDKFSYAGGDQSVAFIGLFFYRWIDHLRFLKDLSACAYVDLVFDLGIAVSNQQKNANRDLELDLVVTCS